MSNLRYGLLDDTSSTPKKASKLTLASLIVVFSAILFIGTEVFTVAAAAIWAAVGMLHLGLGAMLVLSALVGVPAVFVVIKAARMAWAAEVEHGLDNSVR